MEKKSVREKRAQAAVVLVLGIVWAFLLAGTAYAGGESEPASPPPPNKWAGVVLHGESEPLLEGTTWVTNPRMQGSVTRRLIYEFRAEGKLVARVVYSEQPQYNVDWSGTWEREGDRVRVIQEEGLSNSEGKYYPQTQKIMLSVEDTSGETWDVTWEPLAGSSVASAPSAPAAPAYTPPPSAPAQSAPSQPAAPNLGQQIYEAFRSPLDDGAYSLAGTQAKIRIVSIAKTGTLTYTNREGRTGRGVYTFDGSRMTVQMEGYTFIYTVTSRTSFSGNGETWVRTGF